MKIDILTLFPEMFQGPFNHSIVKRAKENGIVTIEFIQIRDYATDKHRQVDDSPFGGGPGMVMKAEPVMRALESIEQSEPSRVILLSPQGRTFNQKIAGELANLEHLVFVCGHYEGLDERIREHAVDEELSIGDYVLTGGEPACIVIVDAVLRLIPGVLGAEEGASEDSFQRGLLEYPQYTRPREFRGWGVPEVLLSGDHAKIARWRREQAILRTFERRSDLLDDSELDKKDSLFLERLQRERLWELEGENS